MQTTDAIKLYMLTKTNRTKLSMISFLVSNGGNSEIRGMADYLCLNEKNVYSSIKTINQELEQLPNIAGTICINNNTVKLNMSLEEQGIVYYHLFDKYCTESSTYIIISTLLKNQMNSIIKISQKTNFSISHVYSKMRVINEFLSLYGIRVRFSKDGRKIIEGTEVQIQYCILDVYWNIFSNTAWFLKQEKSDEITEHIQLFFKEVVRKNLSQGMLYKLYVIIKICLDNFPMTTLENVRTEFKNKEHARLFITPEFDILKKNSPITEEQRILINILARLSVPKIEDSADNLQQYIVLTEQKVPSFIFSKEMIIQFSNEFYLDVPEDKKILYILNFTRNNIYNQYLHASHPKSVTPSFLLFKTKGLAFLRKKIEKFYEDYTTNTLFKDFNSEWVIGNLFHFYNSFSRKKHIVIGVNFTKDYYLNDELSLYIGKIFGDNNVEVKKNAINDADVIISDCPLESQPNRKKIIYYYESEITIDRLKVLLSQLSEVIFELAISK